MLFDPDFLLDTFPLVNDHSRDFLSAIFGRLVSHISGADCRDILFRFTKHQGLNGFPR